MEGQQLFSEVCAGGWILNPERSARSRFRKSLRSRLHKTKPRHTAGLRSVQAHPHLKIENYGAVDPPGVLPLVLEELQNCPTPMLESAWQRSMRPWPICGTEAPREMALATSPVL